MLHIERSVEEGRQVVEANLPAVLTVSKDIAEPRYPSFMGIRKAAKAEIPVWSLADLDCEVPASVVRWPELSSPPVREITTEILTGDDPQQVAQTLVDKVLEEKVL